MTCDAYYNSHPEPPQGINRCDNRQIEAGTAQAVALLGASTTLFGIVNLFVTGWTIKKLGIKSALLIQVFWPAVRLAIQNVGVTTGGANGIIIVQCSQIITIVGGPSGYLLSLTSYVTEICEHKERTGSLGRLQGCAMFGTAVGFLAGGLLSDAFGILTPFRVALALFLVSCLYVFLFLPWIPPNKAELARMSKGVRRLFGPLRIFSPQKWVLRDGRIQTQYGALLLGLGVFLGVLATGYIAVLLQMYSTDTFGFGTKENGYLIFLYALLRGLFLMFAFPCIINVGRNWLKRYNDSKTIANGKPHENEAITDLSTNPEEFNTVEAIENEQEPVEPPKLTDEKETFAFDLLYVKASLILDGILTLAASFVWEGWQIYLVAVLLPFAAGTGAASKGTILQMCLASERTDALSAITLVENLARLSTSTSPVLHYILLDRYTDMAMKRWCLVSFSQLWQISENHTLCSHVTP